MVTRHSPQVCTVAGDGNDDEIIPSNLVLVNATSLSWSIQFSSTRDLARAFLRVFFVIRGESNPSICRKKKGGNYDG